MSTSDFIFNLRPRTYDRLREIRGMASRQRFHLAAILGYKNYGDYLKNFSDRDIRVCEALLGPHGYAVYKMLRAKQSSK